jgi:hypothetical protein
LKKGWLGENWEEYVQPNYVFLEHSYVPVEQGQAIAALPNEQCTPPGLQLGVGLGHFPALQLTTELGPFPCSIYNMMPNSLRHRDEGRIS